MTIDTDGQHSLTDVSSSCAPDGAQLDPADIPKLVEPILRGEANMVNGSRYLNGNKKDTPLYRRLGQVVLDMATNLDSDLSVTNSQSGFRAFANHTKSASRFHQNGLAIESEMLADAAAAGLRIKEAEIGMRVLLKVLHDMELRRQLYYFTAPGIVMSVIGIGMGLDFLRTFYHGGRLFYGPMLLMVLLTLVGSVMALTGIILHTNARAN